MTGKTRQILGIISAGIFLTVLLVLLSLSPVDDPSRYYLAVMAAVVGLGAIWILLMRALFGGRQTR